MPIHIPGHRDRRGKVKGTKRSVVMVLSLTAMVDLFTVLVVFLLQNYNTTGEVIEIRDNVELPNASAVKELKPSNVVVVSKEGIFLNKEKVEEFRQVKEQENWMVDRLRSSIEEMMAKEEESKKTLTNRILDAVSEAKGIDQKPEVEAHKRISIQADKSIDFLTIKKIMFTITESGIVEINFAVIRENEEEQQEASI
ncbi:MAG: biopolymer transporter ExbD [Bdellovibrionales bacterium]|nr:biopolymer transporter ExbD [Bdellovibrionales bacterium]